MSDAREAEAEAEAETVMPRQVRAVQILLFSLSIVGIVSMLALSDGLTAYGQGEMIAPWLFVWVCALLAITYDGSARTGIRVTTIVLMVFMVMPTITQLSDAAAPGQFLDAALRIVLGVPVVVLLFLPETTAWFERER